MPAFIWDTICCSRMKLGGVRQYVSQNGLIQPPTPRVFNWPKSPGLLGLKQERLQMYTMFNSVVHTYTILKFLPNSRLNRTSTFIGEVFTILNTRNISNIFHFLEVDLFFPSTSSRIEVLWISQIFPAKVD